MFPGPDDEMPVDLRDLVGDPSAVALATLAAGVTVLLVLFTYAVAYAPPVEAKGILGSVVSNSDPAVRTRFYQHAFAHDGVEWAPLFLPAFALVAATCVRASRRRRERVRLALAAGIAVAVGYALVGAVGISALPPLDSGAVAPGGLHSDLPAVAVNALVLAAVAAAGTGLALVAVDATTGGASR
jgi:hypothetical protein